MIVKTPNKGGWLHNKYADPLRVNDQNYIFLNVFCNWLESGNSITRSNRKLTNETFTAFHHTTHAILQLN